MTTRRRQTFRNPVIRGFHPDPSICRVGRDFYLATSSFEYFPGVPIFHSRDLVHWTKIGHALTRPSQLDLRRIPSSSGIYAPTLRRARGRYFLVTTNVRGGGNFYVTARHPAGPWSDPVWLDRDGIDPSLLFDGSDVYYTRNGKGPDRDHPRIHQAKIDVDRGRLLGRLRPIWDGTGGIWPEGPHLYKVGTTYYLLTAEGGTGYGHSVVVARSPRPFGPFEPCPYNPILTHRGRPRDPVQAVGHADLVELADGRWWAVLLGVRPKRGRHHHLGRETFLAPVAWTPDGWPILGTTRWSSERGREGRVTLEAAGPALARTGPVVRAQRDDFDRRALDVEWNFLRNPNPRDWSLAERPGHLRLRGSAVTLDDVDSPAMVARRQAHFEVRCRTSLDFAPTRAHEEAGLTVRANENFRYDLGVRLVPGVGPGVGSGLGSGGREAFVRRRVRGESRVVARLALADGPVELEVVASASAYTWSVGPARTRSLARLASLPTRSLSGENIGRSGQSYFTGAYIGLYATGHGKRSRAPADFDWFDYVPHEDG